MRYLRAALARIAGVFTKDRADDELREELQAHIDMATAENVRRGMQPEEARRRAMLAAGGLTQAAEAVRAQRGLPWLEGVAADIKYALRALRHTPAFTTVVVITLALGIGANTTVFTLVNAVLFKGLPFEHSEQIMHLSNNQLSKGRDRIPVSYPDFEADLAALLRG